MTKKKNASEKNIELLPEVANYTSQGMTIAPAAREIGVIEPLLSLEKRVWKDDPITDQRNGIKNTTSWEGGCIVTNDENILHKVRDSGLLGVEEDTFIRRYEGQRSRDFDDNAHYRHYHLSNIMASIGLEQLKRFIVFIKKLQQ